MNARTLALAISLLVLPVCVDAQTKTSPKAEVVVDSTLVARVRAQLATQLGAKPAARVTVTAKDGVVSIVAPELAPSQRDAVVRGARAVPGVKDVVAVVGTVLRPPSAGIVGEKGKVRTNTAGIVGEKGKVRTNTAGIVGEKGKVRANTAGIVGEKGKVRTNTAGIVGEKGKMRTNTAGIVGEKGKVRDSDAALVEAARSRLVVRLGGKAAGQLRVSARDGVVTVQPISTTKPTALQVGEALTGLVGMRRLETW